MALVTVLMFLIFDRTIQECKGIALQRITIPWWGQGNYERSRTMEECCKNCINFHKLEHNFKVGKGYEKSYACDMLLQFDDGDLIVEVSEDGMCEMFTAKEQEHE